MSNSFYRHVSRMSSVRKAAPAKTPPKRPCVTIFSDGSHRPNDGSGGWGAVFVTDLGRDEASGRFKEKCDDSLVAEVRAAACALYEASKRGYLAAENTIIVLQIDSQAAIGCILASDSRYFYTRGPHGRDLPEVKKTYVPAKCAEAVAYIREVVKRHGASLALRHVKGHKSGLSGRHNLNSRADALAGGERA